MSWDDCKEIFANWITLTGVFVVVLSPIIICNLAFCPGTKCVDYKKLSVTSLLLKYNAHIPWHLRHYGDTCGFIVHNLDYFLLSWPESFCGKSAMSVGRCLRTKTNSRKNTQKFWEVVFVWEVEVKEGVGGSDGKSGGMGGLRQKRMLFP